MAFDKCMPLLRLLWNVNVNRNFRLRRRLFLLLVRGGCCCFVSLRCRRCVYLSGEKSAARRGRHRVVVHIVCFIAAFSVGAVVVVVVVVVGGAQSKGVVRHWILDTVLWFLRRRRYKCISSVVDSSNSLQNMKWNRWLWDFIWCRLMSWTTNRVPLECNSDGAETNTACCILIRYPFGIVRLCT